MRIDVDQDIANHLVEHNRSEESLSQTLRRLLQLPASDGPVLNPAEATASVPMSRRQLLGDLLLDVLDKDDAAKKASDVVTEMGKRLALSKTDRQCVAPGIERWKKDVHFVRHALSHANDPLLTTIKRGYWSLTPFGRAAARTARVHLERVLRDDRLVALPPPEVPRR